MKAVQRLLDSEGNFAENNWNYSQDGSSAIRTPWIGVLFRFIYSRFYDIRLVKVLL